MNPVAEEAEKSVQSIRAFCQGKRFESYRLVEYCGVEMLGALDLDPSEVEPRVRVAILEGFHTMWAEHDDRLVLCIWEPWDGPASPPDWERVFAERDLD